MRIVVLTQDGIPLVSLAIPSSLTRDFEHKAFAEKLADKRKKELVLAYTTLHPTIDAKKVGLEDLPALSTYILEMQNVNIIDEKLAEGGER
jgi:hypothetical protein